MTLILIIFAVSILTLYYQRNMDDEGTLPATVYKFKERSEQIDEGRESVQED